MTKLREGESERAREKEREPQIGAIKMAATQLSWRHQIELLARVVFERLF